MSDDEDHGRGGGMDDDLSLPKATVQKLINDLMPQDIICAKETRDLLSNCCVEFIHLISSEANDACEKDQKKTIAPEHVVAALKALGFDNYVEGVEGVLDEHKEHVKVRAKKQSASGAKSSGMSDEQLLAMQAEMFAASKARFEAGGGGAPAAE